MTSIEATDAIAETIAKEIEGCRTRARICNNEALDIARELVARLEDAIKSGIAFSAMDAATSYARQMHRKCMAAERLEERADGYASALREVERVAEQERRANGCMDAGDALSAAWELACKLVDIYNGGWEADLYGKSYDDVAEELAELCETYGLNCSFEYDQVDVKHYIRVEDDMIYVRGHENYED